MLYAFKTLGQSGKGQALFVAVVVNPQQSTVALSNAGYGLGSVVVGEVVKQFMRAHGFATG